VSFPRGFQAELVEYSSDARPSFTHGGWSSIADKVMNLQHFEIDPADILRVWINAEIDGFGLLLAEVRRQLAKVYVV